MKGIRLVTKRLKENERIANRIQVLEALSFSSLAFSPQGPTIPIKHEMNVITNGSRPISFSWHRRAVSNYVYFISCLIGMVLPKRQKEKEKEEKENEK